MNYPDSKMGLNGNGNGVLTTKQKFQHFRVIPGLCGVAGTISFESVAKPGSFLYIYKDFILLANYAVIEQKKRTCFYPRYNKYFIVRIRVHLKQNVKHNKFFKKFFFNVFQL